MRNGCGLAPSIGFPTSASGNRLYTGVVVDPNFVSLIRAKLRATDAATPRTSDQNKSGSKVLLGMTKSKPMATGPMSTQSLQIATICPTLPLMRTVRDGLQIQ
jgi:hypothetical protein